jgi:hypothetical protein
VSMKINRRGILKMLPSLPMAARAAQRQAEKMTGIAVDGRDDELMESLHGGGRDGIKGRAAIKLLRVLGIPEWKKRSMKRRARYNRLLDPDIAALKSVSLSGRIGMQWRKNEQRSLERMEQDWIDDEDRDEFLRKHNLDWF